MCFSFDAYMHGMRRLAMFSADCLAEEDGKIAARWKFGCDDQNQAGPVHKLDVV